MKSILERAKEYANSICDRYEWGVENKEWKLAYQRYMDIVTEQKELDIEKACEWLKENAQDYTFDDGYFLNDYNLINDFRKAMEE